MPPQEGKAGNIYVWLISVLFFLVLLAGGVFLALYIFLPVDVVPPWFAFVGMILVALPWMFWILTCIYRCGARRLVREQQQPPVRAAAVAPSASSKSGSSIAGSQGGARRVVRFGNATTVGSPDAAAKAPPQQGHNSDGSSHRLGNGSVDGSSLNSHESEVPLAFSISSSC
ncbi:uncharacterized protein [Typha latifolia]|uniref:uncharacterized protein n=1 Tax=Typha latifolia TaxID=4733 RepID=UPI003C2E88E9